MSLASCLYHLKLHAADIPPTSAKRPPLELPHPHPEPEKSERQDSKKSSLKVVTNCQHIILSFNLLETPSDFFKDSCSTLLDQPFPDTISVSFDGHFLLFCMKFLPASPRPRTVAGVSRIPRLIRWMRDHSHHFKDGVHPASRYERTLIVENTLANWNYSSMLLRTILISTDTSERCNTWKIL